MSLITNHRFRNLGYRFHGGGIFPQLLIASAAVSTSIALDPSLPGRLIPAAAVSTSIANDPSLVFGNVNIAAPVAVSTSVAKTPTIIAGSGASAFVQDATAFPIAPLAYASNVTAANLLIAVIGWQGGATGTSNVTDTPTISDTLGNTWTALAVHKSAGILNGQLSVGMRIFYCENCLGGANTVTIAGMTADSNYALSVYEFSGILTAGSLDASVNTLAANSFTAAPTSAALVTNVTDMIFVAYTDPKHSMGTITAGTGYTLGVKNQTHADAQEYKNTVASGSYTPAFALTGTSKAWAMQALAFKVA